MLDIDKESRRRFIKNSILASAGFASGVSFTEWYEKLSPYGLAEEFRREYTSWMNKLSDIQSKLNHADQTLTNLSQLESDDISALSQYEKDALLAIAGLQSVIDKYASILDKKWLQAEQRTVDILKADQQVQYNLRNQVSSLRSQLSELEQVNEELWNSLTYTLEMVRDPDPRWFFGANMRVGLDAWSSKTTEELVLQLSASRLMGLNCLRIVFDVWKYVRPYQFLSDVMKRELKKIADSIWRAGARTLFTFDKVMWMNSDSEEFWIGYQQYRDAILDMVRLLKDHPAIVAYDLSNEPILAIEGGVLEKKITRKQADSWISELKEVYSVMRKDILSIDSDCLITVGDSDPRYIEHFKDIVDFTSFHDTGMWSPYPEENTWDGTPEDLRKRLRQKIGIAKSYGKPVVLEEYGTDPNYVYNVQKWRLGTIKYHPKDYWNVILEEAEREGIGALFWVVNIKANDPWNLAVRDDGELTEIGWIVQKFSFSRLRKRLSSSG